MKRILCVAVLMGLTTALHAVTYTWDSGSSSFKNGTETLGAYTNISKLVITVECKGTTDVVAHDYFAITQQGGANLLKFEVAKISAATGPGNPQVTVTNNSALKGDSRFTQARAGKNKSFTTVFTFSDPDDQGAFQKLVADYTFTTANTTKSDTWTSGVNANFNGKSFDKLEVFDGVEIISASIEIVGTSVPEPGLLALLALGGAGLVLQRRRKILA